MCVTFPELLNCLATTDYYKIFNPSDNLSIFLLPSLYCAPNYTTNPPMYYPFPIMGVSVSPWNESGSRRGNAS